jgi:hypothetical protein
VRTAHETFRDIGAEAFVERVSCSLLATAERARKRSMRTREELTAHEAQIARHLACANPVLVPTVVPN